MQTFKPDELPGDAPRCGAGGALGVCLALWMTALLAFWLAQDSLAAYWHAHYQRPSPLLALERFALWRTGAQVQGQVQERSQHWREALVAPLRSATPDASASISDEAGDGAPLLLAMAAPATQEMAHEAAPAAAEVALYEPPLPAYRLPAAPVRAGGVDEVDEQEDAAHGAGVSVPLQRHRHEVFFAGDSMMEGVAPHVALWLKKQGIRSTNRSRLSTGLTYPNAKTRDWPHEIAQALATNARLKLIIMFLGPNDPWDMPTPGARGRRFLRFGAPEWEEEYRRRISAILDAAASHGAHVIWMGPPPMRRARLHAQMEYLDEVMRSEVEGRAVYVSTRALLSSEAGGYTERVDIDGRMVGVRAPDGIHFTPAGQRLLARAVQEHIRILGSEAAAPSPSSAPVQLAAAPLPEPAPAPKLAPEPAPAAPPPPPPPALPVINADGTVTLAANQEAFFAGDSMMQGLAPHIALWLKQQGVASRNRSRYSTGLTYPNAQTRDWPQEIEQALAANKRLKLIFMFVGPNDPLDMPDPAAQGKRFLRFATPGWEAEYRRRITRILDAADKHGARLVWLGLPTMRAARYEHKMAYLDGVIRSATEGRALYLPTRNLLAEDEDASYTASLTIEGKKTIVRASDGIHFSSAGLRIVADAVQQRIRIAPAASAPAAAASIAAPAASAPPPAAAVAAL